MNLKSIKRAIVGLVLMGPIAVGSLDAVPPAHAAIWPHLTYTVTIQGNVDGYNFIRRGGLVVGSTITTVTTNGVNVVDICLVSGNPPATPETGAIWFFTNTFCAGSRAALDMTDVRVSGNTVQVCQDPNMSAVGMNVFNATSGLTAGLKQIFSGCIALRFSSDLRSCTGFINILGTDAVIHSNAPYRAVISGTRVA